jgi:hypothetical protein
MTRHDRGSPDPLCEAADRFETLASRLAGNPRQFEPAGRAAGKEEPLWA